MERTTKINPSPMILACDPSLTAWGYSVCHGKKIVDVGKISTVPESKKRRIREGDDRVKRITEIATQLNSLISTYHISFIVSELPHGSQSYHAAIMVGLVPGLLQGIAITRNIPIEWYSEADAKKCLLGKSAATKDEVIAAIAKLYQVPWSKFKLENEAIADSLAIYHIAVQQSPAVSLISRYL